MAKIEGRRTGCVVHQVLLHGEDPRVTGGCSRLLQLQMFSQQLVHTREQIDFTACGLFPLDMTLLHSVVGAVTTYIIILMQFQTK
ncbi:putative gustatory receptor 28b [Zootermopsis nevadensis]|uniref:putative gustatory receptor 28b n=1 Tax=Zootermopsis nevadensis TaxID=136037 RepID=UPI000B8E3A25|nr:putative gustatory receptor 28b [Zootermopsis nevadensis]